MTHCCHLEHKVLMAAHHPLATKPRLTLKEIAAHPIAIPPANYAVRQLLESAARREAVHFDMRFITSSMEVQRPRRCRAGRYLFCPSYIIRSRMRRQCLWRYRWPIP